MPRSMTGYGIGEASQSGHKITAEIRSVNNRFLDLRVKLPRNLYSRETDIRELFKAKAQRGSVSIFVNESIDDAADSTINLNHARIKDYINAFTEINETYRLLDQIKLSHLLKFEDIFSTDRDEAYMEMLWNLTKEAFDIALANFIEISTQEGRNLVNDIKERLRVISKGLDLVKKAESTQVSQYQDKLNERLSELLTDKRIDPDRLETEIALVADRLDISEELVRLDSHIMLFESELNNETVSGKKLNFILQELGREVNTIASKSWLVEISQLAIKVKEILEQIREQVQNLE